MLTKLVCLGLLALGATGQNIPAGVKYDLTGLTYPPVGRVARVQGVVKLELIPNGTGQEIKLISGPAMAVYRGSENLVKWRTNQPVTVNYIFNLRDPEIMNMRVPKADAFERLFLRMFHLPTYTEQPRCQESSIEPSTSKPRVVQQSPLILEIEITASVPCLNTETSLVASR
jgi:hypothetical protein